MDEEMDPHCILCAVDLEVARSKAERWELAATYYAVGMAAGHKPERAPVPCDRHIGSIAMGAALLGRVCGVSEEETERYKESVREKGEKIERERARERRERLS